MLTRRRALSVAGASLAFAALPQPAPAQQERTTLTVGSSLDDGITPTLYALQTGLFERFGLDVKLQSFSNGPALSAAVAGGAVEIGKSALFPLTVAHVHGVPLKLVAGAAQYDSQSPTLLLIVRKDSAIQTVRDLQGKTVANSALQSVDAVATRAWIDQHGGNSSLVNFTELPFTAMVPALEAGRVAAVSPANPMLQQALDSGTVRVLAPVYDAIAKKFLIAAWFCTQSYVEQNRDALRRFAQAMYQASAYTNAHHAETVDLLSSYSHIPAEVIRRMNRQTNATALDPAAIEPTIAVQVKYGLLPHAFPAAELIADLRG